MRVRWVEVSERGSEMNSTKTKNRQIKILFGLIFLIKYLFQTNKQCRVFCVWIMFPSNDPALQKEISLITITGIMNFLL